MKKLTLTLFAALILTGCTTTVNQDNSSNTTSSSPNSVVSADAFSIEADYVSNNTWEYAVTATMPSPCYSFTVDVLVRESFPEQVGFDVVVVEPDADTACIQVIDEQTKTGTFQASESAKVDSTVTIR